MELTDRKKKILQAIIRNYLESGEPVGSRTISKYTDLNLSSATIRNEMADLEEMGYILQPHTSAGRIPSDAGYRLYVDELMIEKQKEVDELKGEHRNKLKFIQLTKVNSEQLLAVIVVEGNVIKNSIIDIAQEMDEETILKLNILLNTHLNGLSIEEINLAMITALKQQAGIHSDLIGEVIDAVAQAIHEEEDLEIYTSGANNILKYPELSDNHKASELINTLEEKQVLGRLVKDTLEDESSTGIQVYIGDESPITAMKDCSIVTATYDLGEGMKGTIGIIGPKRMDYDKVVDNLKNVMNQLDSIYKK